MAYPFKRNFPIYLIIDTNWWIYILDGQYEEIFKKIQLKVNSGDFKIVTCKYSLLEWEKHKKIFTQNIETKIKNLTKIEKNLKGSDKEIVKKSKDIIKKYELEKTKKLISEIDDILYKKSVKAPITPKVKNLVIEHGFKKIAPFKEKNSTADALILFSATEYIKKENIDALKSSVFVSANYKDFAASKDDKNKINDDLTNHLNDSGMTFETNIATAFQLTADLENEINIYIDKSIDDYIEDMIDRESQYMIDISRGK